MIKKFFYNLLIKKSSTTALEVKDDAGTSFFVVDTINGKIKAGTSSINVSNVADLNAGQSIDLNVGESYVGNLYVNATLIASAATRTSKIYSCSDRYGTGNSIVETYTINGSSGGITLTLSQVNTGGLNNVIRITNGSVGNVRLHVSFIGAKGF